MKLSQKQEIFCIEYNKTGNAAEAYRRAGYNVKDAGSATSAASRLLTSVNIQERLRELGEKAENEAIASIQEMQSMLTKIIREELDEEQIVLEGKGMGITQAVSKRKQAALKDRLRAIELLGKMKGAFVENIKVSGNVPIIISGDDKLED